MTRSSFDRAFAVSRITAFASLLPDELATLVERSQESSLAPHETFAANDGGGGICLLHEGVVEVGPERRRVESPALVGALEALAQRSLTLRAGGEGARVSTLERADLEWVMADVYEVWIAMLRHFAGRWLDADPQLVERPRIVRPGPPHTPTSLVARILLLSESDLFGDFRAMTVGRLAHAAEEIELDPGGVLWEADDASVASYFLLEGAFEVNGRDSPISGSGTVLGAREALADRPRTTRVAAASATRVLRLTNEVLIDELEDDPGAAAALLASIARRTLDVDAAPATGEAS